MLIKIGTQKYHLFIEVFYYYDKRRLINIFGFGISGLFAFEITTDRPHIGLTVDTKEGHCRPVFYRKRAI